MNQHQLETSFRKAAEEGNLNQIQNILQHKTLAPSKLCLINAFSSAIYQGHYLIAKFLLNEQLVDMELDEVLNYLPSTLRNNHFDIASLIYDHISNKLTTPDTNLLQKYINLNSSYCVSAKSNQNILMLEFLLNKGITLKLPSSSQSKNEADHTYAARGEHEKIINYPKQVITEASLLSFVIYNSAEQYNTSELNNILNSTMDEHSSIYKISILVKTTGLLFGSSLLKATKTGLHLGITIEQKVLGFMNSFNTSCNLGVIPKLYPNKLSIEDTLSDIFMLDYLFKAEKTLYFIYKQRIVIKKFIELVQTSIENDIQHHINKIQESIYPIKDKFHGEHFYCLENKIKELKSDHIKYFKYSSKRKFHLSVLELFSKLENVFYESITHLEKCKLESLDYSESIIEGLKTKIDNKELATKAKVFFHILNPQGLKPELAIELENYISTEEKEDFDYKINYCYSQLKVMGPIFEESTTANERTIEGDSLSDSQTTIYG